MKRYLIAFFLLFPLFFLGVKLSYLELTFDIDLSLQSSIYSPSSKVKIASSLSLFEFKPVSLFLLSFIMRADIFARDNCSSCMLKA